MALVFLPAIATVATESPAAGGVVVALPPWCQLVSWSKAVPPALVGGPVGTLLIECMARRDASNLLQGTVGVNNVGL